ncbi:hypothetical protein K7X08_003059 [Anisodus acutangulus]|uniref:Uncharacterized protein n=1 Tax=Anisodus acutangulus TaxID=402998 RepID=A0A9Q1MEN7_9SOLA|nr:hypothetical protein K7X08_003059 [Anisodus acutangulus]
MTVTPSTLSRASSYLRACSFHSSERKIGFVRERKMQRVRVSSHRAPVQRLGDSQMTLSPKFRIPVDDHMACRTVYCCDNRIVVVGRNLHVAVGHITSQGCSFSVHWQVVDAPESLSDFTPSSAQVLFA